MAKETPKEYIAYLEERRDEIRAQLKVHSSYKALEAQGRDAARTEFTDPAKLKDELREVMAELQTAYLAQGT